MYGLHDTIVISKRYLAVQDEIADAVSTAIVPAVAASERRRAFRKPPHSLSAWEAYQRGIWHSTQAAASENALAMQYLRRSINLDPSFAPAHAALSEVILKESALYPGTEPRGRTGRG